MAFKRSDDDIRPKIVTYNKTIKQYKGCDQLKYQQDQEIDD